MSSMAEKEKNKAGNNKTCMICGQPSSDAICESCKDLIRGEAIEKKQKIEKEGRTDTNRK
jgi:hypothetical protein